MKRQYVRNTTTKIKSTTNLLLDACFLTLWSPLFFAATAFLRADVIEVMPIESSSSIQLERLRESKVLTWRWSSESEESLASSSSILSLSLWCWSVGLINQNNTHKCISNGRHNDHGDLNFYWTNRTWEWHDPRHLWQNVPIKILKKCFLEKDRLFYRIYPPARQSKKEKLSN